MVHSPAIMYLSQQGFNSHTESSVGSTVRESVTLAPGAVCAIKVGSRRLVKSWVLLEDGVGS